MDKRFANSEISNTNTEFYEEFAPFYRQHYSQVTPAPTVKQWAAKLTELGRIPELAFTEKRRKLRLLEIGCGPGAFLQEWAQQGFQVAGLDSSSKMIEFADRLLRTASLNQPYQLIHADIREIDENCNYRQFDLAVSHFNFLNLFSPLQLAEVFSGAWRLLKPGAVWMTDFCELIGDLEDLECDDRIKQPDDCVRRSERFFPAEGRLDVHWVVQRFDMVERYWLKNTAAIRSSAEQVGFHVILINQRSLTNQPNCVNSEVFINQLVAIFAKASGHGHPSPENLEDRQYSTRVL